MCVFDPVAQEFRNVQPIGWISVVKMIEVPSLMLGVTEFFLKGGVKLVFGAIVQSIVDALPRQLMGH